jgi:hypothetical protein
MYSNYKKAKKGKWRKCMKKKERRVREHREKKISSLLCPIFIASNDTYMVFVHKNDMFK